MNSFEKSTDITRRENLDIDCDILENASENFLIIYNYCKDLSAYWETDQKKEPNIYPGKDIPEEKNTRRRSTSLRTANIKSLIQELKDEIKKIEKYQDILVAGQRPTQSTSEKTANDYRMNLSTPSLPNPLSGILSTEVFKAMRHLLAHWENLDCKLCATEECKPNS
jgi:hypothetical protein